jgi:hypothetical protein
MLYKWRFERALRDLGYDPGGLSRSNRQSGISNARVSGDTPQEAAIIFVATMPVQRRRRPNPKTMNNWVRQGKLDLKKGHIRHALEKVGLRDFRA